MSSSAGSMPKVRRGSSRGRDDHGGAHSAPPQVLEDEIVELRKLLSDEGLDAGAHTIAFHLVQRHGEAPSVATVWRILSRRAPRARAWAGRCGTANRNLRHAV
jgi:hypothetical protein